MITPVGVEKPKGKKKGKVFVDDRVGFFSFFSNLGACWMRKEDWDCGGEFGSIDCFGEGLGLIACAHRNP